MKSILDKVMPSVPMQEKEKVIDYLDKSGKYLSSNDNPLNIRTLQKSIKLESTGAANWKDLVARYAG